MNNKFLNVFSLITIILLMLSCSERRVYTINCSKNSIFYVDTQIQYSKSIEIKLNDFCCDSIELVCVEIGENDINETEIYEIAKKNYKKILFNKDNFSYKDDWYAPKFAIVILSNLKDCNKQIELKVKISE